jgi:hypothetical protein
LHLVLNFGCFIDLEISLDIVTCGYISSVLWVVELMYFRVKGVTMFLETWFLTTRIFTFLCKSLKLCSFVIGKYSNFRALQ